ncbi:hypothetical protein AWU65_24215 [Paenibacillus glucanolyticus]|uniref:Uncharacterized protein n=1 Tax=Paenibacillus glucanolyticus TaxID=59843 RepID=A0A163M7P2_9BACL|nr:hypothetical protein [Paenibacillus glucanolyticus]KZS48818.1 hypothetical protein AWU65_24215 [Paenibacillus glucanolyticus]
MIWINTNQIKDHIAASADAICVMKDNTIIHEWYSGFHHFHKSARKVDEYSQFNERRRCWTITSESGQQESGGRQNFRLKKSRNYLNYE